MTEPQVVWLQWGNGPEPDSKALGGKAANLMKLVAAGMPVPAAFCLTTAGYREFLLHNGLNVTASREDLIKVFETAPFPPALAETICDFGAKLAAAGHQLAVRSSATVEDQASASFAGQGESFLGVQGDTELLAAVRACWASLWSVRAQSYQQSSDRAAPQMAVIVQAMVPCDLSGIAFSIDPLHGTPAVVVEAVPGLGDGLAAGHAAGARYRVDREYPVYETGSDSLLNSKQLAQVVELAMTAEELFGGPQDIEWGFVGTELFVFQSRPITVRSTGFFTEHLPDDDYWWTSGFFNERFPRPVSPLGWTLLRELLAPLALGDPLRFLGVPAEQIPPLVKLYRGHPYANVGAFQRLYAVFPDWMLPADSYRYFPDGDTALRHAVKYPRGIGHPRTFLSLARTFLQQPAAASPWHNWRTWQRFERRHTQTMLNLEREFQGLGRPRPASAVWKMLQGAQDLNRELLGLHRWSLTLADLTYTLLRKLLSRALPDPEAVESVAAALVTGLPSYSLQLDAALYRLAAGEEELARFLLEYGHRSFDLDIAHPTFADDASQLDSFLERLAAGGSRPDFDARVAERQVAQRRTEAELRGWQKPLFRHILWLTQAYMQLRENQRFVWQKTLAFQRKLLLALGAQWFERPELIFGATWEEVAAAATGREAVPRQQIEERWAELARLEQEHRLAPHLTYPSFLRGNQPLQNTKLPSESYYQGLPVSPGIGQGPVRVVLSPAQFDQVRPGDILVTRGADPGWTPLYSNLAGLILETGGQLSHGAVVAREYGLPAVAAIAHITTRLADGQLVTVDGRTGIVTVDEFAEKPTAH